MAGILAVVEHLAPHTAGHIRIVRSFEARRPDRERHNLAAGRCIQSAEEHREAFHWKFHIYWAERAGKSDPAQRDKEQAGTVHGLWLAPGAAKLVAEVAHFVTPVGVMAAEKLPADCPARTPRLTGQKQYSQAFSAGRRSHQYPCFCKPLLQDAPAGQLNHARGKSNQARPFPDERHAHRLEIEWDQSPTLDHIDLVRRLNWALMVMAYRTPVWNFRLGKQETDFAVEHRS